VLVDTSALHTVFFGEKAAWLGLDLSRFAHMMLQANVEPRQFTRDIVSLQLSLKLGAANITM
jgi:hypothetical protein